MDRSPGGNEIRKIAGDGADIVTRGSQMESLGMQMRESAAILSAIVSGAEGKGYSIDSLKETAGQVHADLAKAGARYEPSGKVLREYGQTVVDVKDRLNDIVDNCVELWSTYEGARSSFSDANGETPPVDETPAQAEERRQGVADLRVAQDNIYDEWLEEARRYDEPFDTWNGSYENAVNGLEDANDRGVEDSFWDDALPAIEVILNILAVAGVILAVVAIIVGGPFVLLAGAIVGLLALGLTIWKVAAGRGDGWDIFFAGLAVVPFGRLAKLGTLFRGAGTWGSRGLSFAKGFGSDLVGLTAFRELRALRGFSTFLRGPVTNSAGNLTQSQGIINQIRSFGDVVDGISYTGPAGWLARVTGGSGGPISAALSDAFAASGPAVTNRVNQALAGTVLDGSQLASSGVDTVANIIDSIAKPGFGAYRDGSDFFEGLAGDASADRWATSLARS
ncbi:hypothetical protein [Agromyces italicus]|uniref:hypothetical protein n=1 Tax=Agromyces italicus TaxID=279572 RepID=UPI0003B4BE4D|nr:hypothetical protein [Agromyces italicus]